MVLPVGLDRVVEPAGVLPQAAWRLDTRAEITVDEVRIRVERLNLDAASFRQLAQKHGGDGAAVRAEVRGIIEARGKMHNPVTGSGGMLVAVFAEGNAYGRPANSGWWVAEVDKDECKAQASGLVGCKFDGSGAATACGVATINEKTDDVTIVAVKR